ncbi:MAG: ABC transporter ATP-binding protein [Acidimicrobiia bacterium]|nr:ABC transporter ATP-binding protein [Acidimicrobiia bacterium]
MSGLDAHLVVARGETFHLDVELEVPAGETAAVLGPNGSGKSTTIAVLAGLLALDAGHVRLDDTLLDEPSSDTFVPAEQRQVGVVFQDHLLFPHLDVLGNVAFGPRRRGRRRDRAADVARQVLHRLDIAELATRRPRELSGGQAQRVALARALAASPRLLLLDEPFAALDVASRATLRRTLRDDLGELAAPRVLITHDPTDAFLLADRIHVIEGGRIVQSGTAEELARRPRTPWIAELTGLNVIMGDARDGVVTATSGHVLHTAERTTNGPVVVTIGPRSITLHTERPTGSARNSWATQISHVERLGDRARVQVTDPQPLAVEVTPAAVDELGLAPGASVWVSIKATEIDVTPG